MAINTATILDRAEKTLLDEANVEWSRAELLDYLNSTVRFICQLKPDACVLTTSMALTTGTKQSIPTAGYYLHRITRNMGVAGTTAGNVITKVEQNALDRFDPTWHTASGAAVKHYMFDARNPSQFWVYPAVSGTWYVEAEYSAIPADATDGGAVPVKDIYETAIYWGILALAYAKNAVRGDMAKEKGYLDMLGAALGEKEKVAAMFAPVPNESDVNE